MHFSELQGTASASTQMQPNTQRKPGLLAASPSRRHTIGALVAVGVALFLWYSTHYLHTWCFDGILPSSPETCPQWAARYPHRDAPTTASVLAAGAAREVAAASFRDPALPWVDVVVLVPSVVG